MNIMRLGIVSHVHQLREMILNLGDVGVARRLVLKLEDMRNWQGTRSWAERNGPRCKAPPPRSIRLCFFVSSQVDDLPRGEGPARLDRLPLDLSTTRTFRLDTVTLEKIARDPAFLLHTARRAISGTTNNGMY
jgi:hypothetical protein